MTNANRIAAAATEALEIAASVEDWMIEAYTATDAALTAHAIRSAAVEAIEDLKMSLAAYADGYNVPGSELYAMLTAMQSVIEWANTVAA
jgi:hypothetical protein